VELTVAEVRRLVRRLLLAHRPAWDEVVHWSVWRRRHQAIARRCHYKRRGVALP
jgi:DNA-binding IclR family transcriptional regulator